MDVADDAEGRVAIFTVGAQPDPPDPSSPARHRGALRGGSRQVGVWLDSAYGGLGIAILLVLILVLGLVLSRH